MVAPIVRSRSPPHHPSARTLKRITSCRRAPGSGVGIPQLARPDRLVSKLSGATQVSTTQVAPPLTLHTSRFALRNRARYPRNGRLNAAIGGLALWPCLSPPPAAPAPAPATGRANGGPCPPAPCRPLFGGCAPRGGGCCGCGGWRWCVGRPMASCSSSRRALRYLYQRERERGRTGIRSGQSLFHIRRCVS